MKRNFTNSLIFGCLFLSTTLFAQVPQFINFQGYLTDNAGNPETGSFNMSFTLYDDLSASVWTESHVVTVTNGIYNVSLGTSTALPADFNQQYHLEVTVEGEVLSGLISLNSSPYSLNAERLSGTNYIPASGSVGINKTTTNALLDLKSQGTSTNLLILENSATTSPLARFREGSGGNGVFELYDNVGTIGVAMAGNGSALFEGGGVIVNSGSLVERTLSLSNNLTTSSAAIGLQNVMMDGGTGEKYGIYNSISNSASNASLYGTFTEISSSTASPAAGNYTQITNSGSGNTYGNYTYMEGAPSGNMYGLYLEYGEQGSASNYGIYTTGEAHNYFSAAVGIGSSTQSVVGEQLRVTKVAANNINPTMMVENSATNSATAIRFAGPTNHWNVGRTQSDHFSFAYNLNVSQSSDLVTIHNDGFVGIGTNVNPISGISRLAVVSGFATVHPEVVIENTNVNGGTSLRFRGVSAGPVNSTWDIGRTPADEFEIAYNGNIGLSGSHFLIQSDGDVGIGTESPGYRLDVTSTSTDYILNVNKNTASGTALVRFARQGSFTGGIVENAGTVTYSAFTGSHVATSGEKLTEGTLVTVKGVASRLGINKEGEPIYQVTASTIPNDPRVLGSYLFDMDENISTDITTPINMIGAVGNGEMLVIDNGENLAVGDYLISSHVPGCAMRDNGEYELAYIVARVAEDVSWDAVPESVDGVKCKKISIFYESFIRNHKAEKLEVEIESLKTKLKAMEAKTDSFDEQLQSLKRQLGL